MTRCAWGRQGPIEEHRSVETAWTAVATAPRELTFGEIIRFAIRRDYQGAQELATKRHGFRSLLCGTLAFADRQRVGVVLAVMPPTVTRLVIQAGVTIRPVPGVGLAHG